MHNACMGISITIRNVSQEVRDEIAARAEREGKSMQEFLRGELDRIAATPSMDNWLDAVRQRKAAYGTQLNPGQILEARDADRK